MPWCRRGRRGPGGAQPVVAVRHEHGVGVGAEHVADEGLHQEAGSVVAQSLTPPDSDGSQFHTLGQPGDAVASGEEAEAEVEPDRGPPEVEDGGGGYGGGQQAQDRKHAAEDEGGDDGRCDQQADRQPVPLGLGRHLTVLVGNLLQVLGRCLERGPRARRALAGRKINVVGVTEGGLDVCAVHARAFAQELCHSRLGQDIGDSPAVDHGAVRLKEVPHRHCQEPLPRL